MPLPKSPTTWDYEMDPGDRVEFTLDGPGFLSDDEVISSYTLINEPEGVALGLTIGADEYDPALVDGDTALKIWLSVDDAEHANESFAGDGVIVGIRGKFTTNSSPPRRYERTWAVRIIQR
ncbi:hypothetical protein ACSMXM_05480 [Pacificimonas sp. ICDLI1SI03]